MLPSYTKGISSFHHSTPLYADCTTIMLKYSTVYSNGKATDKKTIARSMISQHSKIKCDIDLTNKDECNLRLSTKDSHTMNIYILTEESAEI